MDKALFFEKNGKNYLKYRDKVVLITEKNLEILKKLLDLPYKLLFYGIKKDIIANIMFDMHNDAAECELKEYSYDKKNKKSKYAAIYRAKEQEKENEGRRL